MTVNCQALKSHLTEQIQQILFGMDNTIHGLAMALIGRGHVLLEGAPGLGKTRLSKAFAEVIGGSFKRIQGTSDLMPTDMTGVHVYNTQNGSFEFQQGPLFADVVLMDEVNRAGPKTQSALLEAMEERQVSVDRDTFPLAEDFLVIATQNPREFEGTFPLPESQLDRFALCIPVNHLSREDEARVLTNFSTTEDMHHSAVRMQPMPADLVTAARNEVAQIDMTTELVNYVLDVAAATRETTFTNLGLSIRGALTLTRCARIDAALLGQTYVTPDNVKQVVPWVVPHRISLTAEAAIEGQTPEGVCQHILDQVPVPK